MHEPGRLTVMAAKSVILAGLALAAGAIAVAGSVLAGRLILPGHGFTGAPLRGSRLGCRGRRAGRG